MPDGNQFNGSFTRVPSVRLAVQNESVGSFGAGSRVVALIGQATGGTPGLVYPFSSPQQAKAIFRGGELLQAMFRAFNPSKTGQGPATVYAIRVNPASQASLALDDASSNDSIVVTSVNYGALDNLINIAVAAGTISGKKITISDPSQSFILDNLGQNAFSIVYTGSGSAASMTINAGTLTTVIAGASADDLNLSFANYQTLAQLISYLNSTGVYTAVLLSPNGSDATAANLDFVTGQDIKTSAFTVTENLAAIVTALNSGTQTLVTAARATGAAAVPANTTPLFLSGGTDNGAANHLDGSTNAGHALTNVDWEFCLGQLDTKDVRYMTVLSSDPSVWNLADAHAESVSASGYLPRRNIVGTALGLYTITLSNYIPLAAALNSNRTALVPQGLIDTDELTGNLITFPPYIYAAQLAGLAASMSLGDAITAQFVRGRGLEWTPSQAQEEIAIESGLLISTFDVRSVAVQVVRGISTWLVDNSFENVEMSVGDEVDDVVLQALTWLKPFVGKKGSPDLLIRLASATQSALDVEFKAGVLVGDTIPEPDGSFSPPYKNIVAQINGDEAEISFECSPGIPLNFVNINMKLNVFTGSLQVATA